MRPTIKTALIFVAIWFTIKMVFFKFQLFQDEAGVKVLVMWNILCLLLAISIGTLIEKRREKSSDGSALGDIKRAMGGGMIYTVLVAALLYVYYAKIDPAYNERQLAAAEESVRKLVNDPHALAEQKRIHPEIASLTTEEIMQKSMNSQKAVYSAGSVSTLGMLGMLLLTTINSIVVTVVYRRVLFKQRTL
jgi:hypothetical protein